MDTKTIMNTFIIPEDKEPIEAARAIAKYMKDHQFLYMTGPLGAGKTSLAKELFQELGVPKKTIKSPTYTLKRSYETPIGKINHIDLYRLDKVDLEELVEDDAFHIIEWADKISEFPNVPGLHIDIAINPDQSRIVTVKTLQE